MNRYGYQLLPQENRCPAMEVCLSDYDEDLPGQVAQQNQEQQPQQQQAQAIILEVQSTNEKQQVFDSTLSNDLPSYQEALRQKEAWAQQAYNNNNSNNDTSNTTRRITTVELMNQDDLGTDCMFISSFLLAFFFNWIGFIASICFIPNQAGKFGALSGFGLSMVKWISILRYQDWLMNVNDLQQRIFYGIFFFVGFYLFARGLLSYAFLKHNLSFGIRRSRVEQQQA